MSYKLVFAPSALQDAKYFQKSGDKITLNKIKSLLAELEMHPSIGTGKPERLKHELSGLWSRRVNQRHRIVYSIDENTETVYILSMKSHYNS